MKKLLILDLDNTLIYSSVEKVPCDFIIKLSDQETFYVKKRPGLDHFLQQVYSHFILAVFTAACEDYAHEICNVIFSDYKLLFIWNYVHCNIKHEFGYFDSRQIILKKLDKVFKCTFNFNDEILQFDKHNTIIIDDKPETALDNHENFVRISPYYDEIGEPDTFSQIINKLHEINKSTCVRKVITENKFNEL
jgi:RNA polymerase II subunit A small phosphatase-like protein